MALVDERERVNGGTHAAEQIGTQPQSESNSSERRREDDVIASGVGEGANAYEAIDEERKSDTGGGDDEEAKQEENEAQVIELMYADGGDAVDEDGDDEDDVLVVLELTDFKNHPIFDDYRSIKIEGIDTASPMLTIGEYTLHGQLEETVGTNFFYDTKNRTEQNHYHYVGQTTKKIKFTISPPEP